MLKKFIFCRNSDHRKAGKTTKGVRSSSAVGSEKVLHRYDILPRLSRTLQLQEYNTIMLEKTAKWAKDMNVQIKCTSSTELDHLFTLIFLRDLETTFESDSARHNTST